MKDFSDHNSDLLLDISILYRSTQKYYDQMLQSVSLTYAQLPILILIYENEGISQQRVATEGSYDKGTITKQVQKLEEMGYIRVQPSQKDKRAKELYTTSKARQIMSKVYAIRTSWWQHISASIPQEDMDSFSTFYKNMAVSAREFAQADLSEILFFEQQNISLESYPGKVSTVLSTGGCNFRCPFCNCSHLVFLKENTKSIQESQILQYLTRRKGLLNAVVIKGGEPLMHPELLPFLKKVKALNYDVKLETNGSYSALLKELIDQNLVDEVLFHIKNTKDKYGETIGLKDYDIKEVQSSIDCLQKTKKSITFVFTPIQELHTMEDLLAMARWIQPAQKLELHTYQEKETVIQEGFHGYSPEALKQAQEKIQEIIPNVVIR